MQVQTKRVFFIKLDEDEAEDFLDDATDVQTRVRDQLRSNGNGTQAHTATLRAPKVTKRRSPQPVECPECGETMDPRGLPGHRRRLHGIPSAIVQDAGEPSAE